MNGPIVDEAHFSKQSRLISSESHPRLLLMKFKATPLKGWAAYNRRSAEFPVAKPDSLC